MGSFSIWHWLIVLAVALLLFGGGGKIARIMGDLGSGMRKFRRNLDGDDERDAKPNAGGKKSGKKKKTGSGK